MRTSTLSSMVILIMLHVASTDRSPGVALLTAVQKGRRGRLERIFKRKNLDINYKEKRGKYRGYTALLWATQNNDFGIVEKLIEQGANINHKSYFGITAIYLAAMSGSLKIVEALLQKGASPNIPTDLGFTALLQATWKRHHDVVIELLDKGANPNFQTPLSKYFALYLAARQGDVQIADALLNAKADVNLQTSWGVTALEAATVWGHLELTRLLLKAGANPNLRNNYNQTSLMKASIYGHKDLLPELINAGAQLDLQDNAGCSALIWAGKRGHTTIITKLLEEGADPDLKDNNGITSLQWAKRNGNFDVVKEILENPCSNFTSGTVYIHGHLGEHSPCRKHLRYNTTTKEIQQDDTASVSLSTTSVVTEQNKTKKQFTPHEMSTLDPSKSTQADEPTTNTATEPIIRPKKTPIIIYVTRCSALSHLTPNVNILLLSSFLQLQRLDIVKNL